MHISVIGLISILLSFQVSSLNAQDFRQAGSQRSAVEGTPSNNTYNRPTKETKATRAEQAHQLNLTNAYNRNHEAIGFQKSGDWVKAVALYEEAARLSPDDPIIKANLANAKVALENIHTAEQNQLRIKQQDKTTAANMQEAINNFAQTLSTAPGSSGGLNFDGQNSNSSNGNGNGLTFMPVSSIPAKTTIATGLQFGDPNVVDARNVPSGLGKGMDNAILSAYADEAIAKLKKEGKISNTNSDNTGAFGEPVSNPTKEDLKPRDNTVGTVAADPNHQLKAADIEGFDKVIDGRAKDHGDIAPNTVIAPYVNDKEAKENKLAETHRELIPLLNKERELKKKSDELAKKVDELKNQIKAIPQTDPKQKELVAELAKTSSEKSKVDGDKNMATMEKETKMNSYGVDVDTSPLVTPNTPKTQIKKQ